MYTFEDAIKDYYKKICDKLKSNHIWNDDVFQDTCMKCFEIFISNNHLDRKEIHPENVEKYFMHAYHQNLRRSLQYASEKCESLDEGWSDEDYNGMSYDISDECISQDQEESHIDYWKLRRYFEDNFSVKHSMMYRLYVLGLFSIKELEDKYGEKDLRYLFRKMKESARRHFKGELYN